MYIRLEKHLSWQSIKEESFSYVYNIRTRKYYAFENVEYDIWGLISSGRNVTVDHIVSEIASIYEVELDEVEKDVRSFINELQKEGIVRYE